ncbi:putative Cellulose-binding family II/chitobiase, carbohydrate-binding domain-containing protein [Rosa chinensis]|uniref:Putative Cellulose-binding family II/chitobiase, carbohydrate-binding domain-containing protein n=1 Tax=Rosa chinensis TaxID=74649 RepID=A0A2P6QYU7_ROSCH|nr:COBRA-like protein 7 [Rosa chinensis]PRQ39351.1 putative Cellulose-binding family II/chitobiase, carbohydrate-binding domain-containing protein [Rosa chinensis]
MASMTRPFVFTLAFLTIYTALPLSLSQTTDAPAPAADLCNGVFISYSYTDGKQIAPTFPARQPYRFESVLTVLNNGEEDLKSWKVFVGFQHGEYLVSAANAVLADGSAYPGSVENGTVFAGFPQTDLKTAIKTAGDLTQMQVQVKLLGTQFGVAPPNVPMPANISLANDGFRCPKASLQGKSEMQVCCIVDSTVKTNITADEEFLPRQNGDLSIMYDVTRTYGSSYFAQVTISNHNSLGRLDSWKLSWDWMAQEFINTMRGAYPSVVDSSECIFGEQGQYYADLDFANVLSCEKRPTIIDLPLEKTNDTKLGMIPYCCRNGTILPTTMDATKSKSSFQMEVYKMPPNINRSVIIPPQNWAINGTLNPDYKCGPPVRVSPSQFPDASGLPVNSTAVASWQVVCNITQAKGASPRCCVSFSAYFNESVVPCKTCACGCPRNTAQTCSTTAPAMLLPPESLLVPFENRTVKAKAWAELKHLADPNPMPCGDNCGVSINWHVLSDYSKGWTARVTLFNWGETSFADWFTAVQLDKAVPGFEKMYSFNATTVGTDGVNNTVFMQGLEGLNYLVAEVDGANPNKDPRVPGKQQSVISFTKKLTPGINVAGRDGFPTKVFFNGEECSLPDIYPSSAYRTSSAMMMFPVLLMVAVFMLMQQ